MTEPNQQCDETNTLEIFQIQQAFEFGFNTRDASELELKRQMLGYLAGT